MPMFDETSSVRILTHSHVENQFLIEHTLLIIYSSNHIMCTDNPFHLHSFHGSFASQRPIIPNLIRRIRLLNRIPIRRPRPYSTMLMHPMNSRTPIRPTMPIPKPPHIHRQPSMRLYDLTLLPQSLTQRLSTIRVMARLTVSYVSV
jgi:hypothetical protein